MGVAINPLLKGDCMQLSPRRDDEKGLHTTPLKGRLQGLNSERGLDRVAHNFI